MLNKRLSIVSLGLILTALTISPLYADELIQPPQPAYAQTSTNTKTEQPQDTKTTESPAVSPAVEAQGNQTSPSSSLEKRALADAVTDPNAKTNHHVLSKLPHRLAVFTAGFFINSPLAIAHQAGKESITGVTDLVGTNRNPLILAPAFVISVPYGIASGIFGGPTTTAYHSYKHCGDDPVTKDSLGIGSNGVSSPAGGSGGSAPNATPGNDSTTVSPAK